MHSVAIWLLGITWIVSISSLVQGKSFFANSPTEAATGCGDWVPYKDEKCVKVAVTAGVQTQKEAEDICRSFSGELKLESYPTLITVATKEKQEFLHKLLFDENKIVDNVWLGITETKVQGEFVWNDGSPVDYSNWAKQNTSAIHKCVEMTSGEGGFSAGQWVRVNCLKRNVVVCERAQMLSVEKLLNMFLEYKQQQEKIQKSTANEITSLKRQNVECKNDINNLKQKNEALENNLEILKKGNEAEEKNVFALMQWKETAEKLITTLKLKNDAAEKNIESLKKSYEASEKTIASLKVRNEAADETINDLKPKLNAAQKIITTLQQKNEAAEKYAVGLAQRLAIAEKEIASLKQKVDVSQKAITTVKQQSDGSEKIINDLKQKSEATEKNIATVKQKNEALDKNLSALTQNNVAAENNIGALTQKNQAAQNEINNLKKNPVPVGFIYIELPGQQPPTTLWPQAKWNDVSARYAGLFFRVLGGCSAPFGQIQAGDAPRLEQAEQNQGNHLRPLESNPVTIPADGSWSRYFWDGADKGTNIFMRFHLSRTEVRPRNQAMKVWQRIQ